MSHSVKVCKEIWVLLSSDSTTKLLPLSAVSVSPCFQDVLHSNFLSCVALFIIGNISFHSFLLLDILSLWTTSVIWCYRRGRTSQTLKHQKQRHVLWILLTYWQFVSVLQAGHVWVTNNLLVSSDGSSSTIRLTPQTHDFLLNRLQNYVGICGQALACLC